jgi:hypothetical protein
VEKGKYALQFDQRVQDSNNDDGGATSNFSGSSGISGSSSGSFSAWAAAAAGFSCSRYPSVRAVHL